MGQYKSVPSTAACVKYKLPYNILMIKQSYSLTFLSSVGYLQGQPVLKETCLHLSLDFSILLISNITKKKATTKMPKSLSNRHFRDDQEPVI